mmetsp:Transcript_1410/g.1993  ORF Transcript_1410/g.1993 Transcript_1410/m.1993 type:complete len:509 (+) Transcript_1410:34-1560(+)
MLRFARQSLKYVRSRRFFGTAMHTKPQLTEETKAYSSIPGPKIVPEAGGTIYDIMQRFEESYNMYEVFDSYRNDFGDVVKHNMGGKEQVWIYDPNDIKKIFQREGQFPKVSVTNLWPIIQHLKRRGLPTTLLGESNEKQQALRRVLQKEITTPRAPMTYLPLLHEPVNHISENFPHYAEDLGEFSPLAAMDMFFSVMIGFNPKSIVGIERGALEKDIEFANSARLFLGALGPMIRDYRLGEDSEEFKNFTKGFDYVLDNADGYFQYLTEKHKKGVYEHEVRPYFARILDAAEIPPEELMPSFTQLLAAGIDTTSVVMQNLLINLARNTDVQQELREELYSVMGKDGDMQEEHFKQIPFLNATMRESHRITPPGTATTSRTMTEGIQIGGYDIPVDVEVMFNMRAIQNDPKYVEDPHVFNPHRWLPDAVSKRKGTESEIIDSPIIRHPFGFGPRMCLGYRIAELEIRMMTSKIIRDYEIELKDPDAPIVYIQELFARQDPIPQLKVKKI